MADLLRCVDQWGREIVLTEELWTGHILAGHSELTGLEACIKVALTDPRPVTFDSRHRGRENYYRAGTLPPPLAHPLLKVCVRFRSMGLGQPESGEVVTAYPVDKVKHSEVIKWP
jgi:hypothetical protein